MDDADEENIDELALNLVSCIPRLESSSICDDVALSEAFDQPLLVVGMKSSPRTSGVSILKYFRFIAEAEHYVLVENLELLSKIFRELSEFSCPSKCFLAACNVICRVRVECRRISTETALTVLQSGIEFVVNCLHKSFSVLSDSPGFFMEVVQVLEVILGSCGLSSIPFSDAQYTAFERELPETFPKADEIAEKYREKILLALRKYSGSKIKPKEKQIEKPSVEPKARCDPTVCRKLHERLRLHFLVNQAAPYFKNLIEILSKLSTSLTSVPSFRVYNNHSEFFHLTGEAECWGNEKMIDGHMENVCSLNSNESFNGDKSDIIEEDFRFNGERFAYQDSVTVGCWESLSDDRLGEVVVALNKYLGVAVRHCPASSVSPSLLKILMNVLDSILTLQGAEKKVLRCSMLKDLDVEIALYGPIGIIDTVSKAKRSGFSFTIVRQLVKLCTLCANDSTEAQLLGRIVFNHLADSFSPFAFQNRFAGDDSEVSVANLVQINYVLEFLRAYVSLELTQNPAGCVDWPLLLIAFLRFVDKCSAAYASGESDANRWCSPWMLAAARKACVVLSKTFERRTFCTQYLTCLLELAPLNSYVYFNTVNPVLSALKSGRLSNVEEWAILRRVTCTAVDGSKFPIGASESILELLVCLQTVRQKPDRRIQREGVEDMMFVLVSRGIILSLIDTAKLTRDIEPNAQQETCISTGIWNILLATFETSTHTTRMELFILLVELMKALYENKSYSVDSNGRVVLTLTAAMIEVSAKGWLFLDGSEEGLVELFAALPESENLAECTSLLQALPSLQKLFCGLPSFTKESSERLSDNEGICSSLTNLAELLTAIGRRLSEEDIHMTDVNCRPLLVYSGVNFEESSKYSRSLLQYSCVRLKASLCSLGFGAANPREQNIAELLPRLYSVFRSTLDPRVLEYDRRETSQLQPLYDFLGSLMDSLFALDQCGLSWQSYCSISDVLATSLSLLVFLERQDPTSRRKAKTFYEKCGKFLTWSVAIMLNQISATMAECLWSSCRESLPTGFYESTVSDEKKLFCALICFNVGSFKDYGCVLAALVGIDEALLVEKLHETKSIFGDIVNSSPCALELECNEKARIMRTYSQYLFMLFDAAASRQGEASRQKGFSSADSLRVSAKSLCRLLDCCNVFDSTDRLWGRFALIPFSRLTTAISLVLYSNPHQTISHRARTFLESVCSSNEKAIPVKDSTSYIEAEIIACIGYVSVLGKSTCNSKDLLPDSTNATDVQNLLDTYTLFVLKRLDEIFLSSKRSFNIGVDHLRMLIEGLSLIGRYRMDNVELRRRCNSGIQYVCDICPAGLKVFEVLNKDFYENLANEGSLCDDGCFSLLKTLMKQEDAQDTSRSIASRVLANSFLLLSQNRAAFCRVLDSIPVSAKSDVSHLLCICSKALEVIVGKLNEELKDDELVDYLHVVKTCLSVMGKVLVNDCSAIPRKLDDNETIANLSAKSQCFSRSSLSLLPFDGAGAQNQNSTAGILAISKESIVSPRKQDGNDSVSRKKSTDSLNDNFLEYDVNDDDESDKKVRDLSPETEISVLNESTDVKDKKNSKRKLSSKLRIGWNSDILRNSHKPEADEEPTLSTSSVFGQIARLGSRKRSRSASSAQMEMDVTGRRKKTTSVSLGDLNSGSISIPIYTKASACTYTETGNKYRNQHWYYCYDCDLVKEQGCCGVCIRQCHAGHDIAYGKKSQFFCDCGAGKRCKTGRRRIASTSDVESIKDLDFLGFLREEKEQKSRKPAIFSTLEGNGSTKPTAQLLIELGLQCSVITNRSRLSSNDKKLQKVLTKCASTVANLLDRLLTLRESFAVCSRLESPEDYFFVARRATEPGVIKVENRNEALLLNDGCSNAFSAANGANDVLAGMFVPQSSSARDSFRAVSELNVNVRSTFFHRQLISVNKNGNIFVAEGQTLRCIHMGALVCDGARSSNGSLFSIGSNSISEASIVPLYKVTAGFDIHQIELNAEDESYVALSGEKDCIVLFLSKKGSVKGKFRLELAPGTSKWEVACVMPAKIIGIAWLRSNRRHLLVVSTCWIKLYDLFNGCTYPTACFEYEERITTFSFAATRRESNPWRTNILVGLSSGKIFHQCIDLSLSAVDTSHFVNLLVDKNTSHNGAARCGQILNIQFLRGSISPTLLTSYEDGCCYSAKVSPSLDSIDSQKRIICGKACATGNEKDPDFHGSYCSSAIVQWFDWVDRDGSNTYRYLFGLHRSRDRIEKLYIDPFLHELKYIGTDELKLDMYDVSVGNFQKSPRSNCSQFSKSETKNSSSTMSSKNPVVSLCLWPHPQAIPQVSASSQENIPSSYYSNISHWSTFKKAVDAKADDGEDFWSPDGPLGRCLPNAEFQSRFLLLLCENGQVFCLESRSDSSWKTLFSRMKSSLSSSADVTREGRAHRKKKQRRRIPQDIHSSSPFVFEHLEQVSSSFLSSSFSWGGNVLRATGSSQRSSALLCGSRETSLPCKSSDKVFVATAQLACPGWSLVAARIRLGPHPPKSSPPAICVGPLGRRIPVTVESSRWIDIVLTPIETLLCAVAGVLELSFPVKFEGSSYAVDAIEVYACSRESKFWVSLMSDAKQVLKGFAEAEFLDPPKKLISAPLSLVDSVQAETLDTITQLCLLNASTQKAVEFSSISFRLEKALLSDLVFGDSRGCVSSVNRQKLAQFLCMKRNVESENCVVRLLGLSLDTLTSRLSLSLPKSDHSSWYNLTELKHIFIFLKRAIKCFFAMLERNEPCRNVDVSQSFSGDSLERVGVIFANAINHEVSLVLDSQPVGPSKDFLKDVHLTLVLFLHMCFEWCFELWVTEKNMVSTLVNILAALVSKAHYPVLVLVEETVLQFCEDIKELRLNEGQCPDGDRTTDKPDKVSNDREAETIQYRCDGCGKTPLTGTRHHCLDCDDFDLCGDCIGLGFKQHKSSHAMVSILLNPAKDTDALPESRRNSNLKLRVDTSRFLSEFTKCIRHQFERDECEWTFCVVFSDLLARFEYGYPDKFEPSLVGDAMSSLVDVDRLDDVFDLFSGSNHESCSSSKASRALKLLLYLSMLAARKDSLATNDCEGIVDNETTDTDTSNVVDESSSEELVLYVLKIIALIVQGSESKEKALKYCEEAVPRVTTKDSAGLSGSGVDTASFGAGLLDGALKLWSGTFDQKTIVALMGDYKCLTSFECMGGQLLKLSCKSILALRGPEVTISVAERDTFVNVFASLVLNPAFNSLHRDVELVLGNVLQSDNDFRWLFASNIISKHMLVLRSLRDKALHSSKLGSNAGSFVGRLGLMASFLPSCISLKELTEFSDAIDGLLSLSSTQCVHWLRFCLSEPDTLECLFDLAPLFPDGCGILLLRLISRGLPAIQANITNIWLDNSIDVSKAHMKLGSMVLARDCAVVRELTRFLVSGMSVPGRWFAGCCWRRLFRALMAPNPDKSSKSRAKEGYHAMMRHLGMLFERGIMSYHHPAPCIALCTTLLKDLADVDAIESDLVSIAERIFWSTADTLRECMMALENNNGSIRARQVSSYLRYRTCMDSDSASSSTKEGTRKYGEYSESKLEVLPPYVLGEDRKYCVPCRVPLRPYKMMNLSLATAETKFTPFSMLVSLDCMYTVDALHVDMSMHSSVFGCVVEAISVFCNSSPSTELSTLQNRKQNWYRICTLHIAADEKGESTESSATFPVPVSLCNLMFQYETTSTLEFNRNSDRHVCPRCSEIVSNQNGICQCGEVVFQCRQCGRIYQEDRNAFLCVECGYSRYAEFSYSLKAQVSTDYPPILSEADRDRALAHFHSFEETATSVERSLRELQCQSENEAIELWNRIGAGASDGVIPVSVASRFKDEEAAKVPSKSQDGEIQSLIDTNEPDAFTSRKQSNDGKSSSNSLVLPSSESMNLLKTMGVLPSLSFGKSLEDAKQSSANADDSLIGVGAHALSSKGLSIVHNLLFSSDGLNLLEELVANQSEDLTFVLSEETASEPLDHGSKKHINFSSSSTCNRALKALKETRKKKQDVSSQGAQSVSQRHDIDALVLRNVSDSSGEKRSGMKNPYVLGTSLPQQLLDLVKVHSSPDQAVYEKFVVTRRALDNIYKALIQYDQDLSGKLIKRLNESTNDLCIPKDSSFYKCATCLEDIRLSSSNLIRDLVRIPQLITLIGNRLQDVAFLVLKSAVTVSSDGFDVSGGAIVALAKADTQCAFAVVDYLVETLSSRLRSYDCLNSCNFLNGSLSLLLTIADMGMSSSEIELKSAAYARKQMNAMMAEWTAKSSPVNKTEVTEALFIPVLKFILKSIKISKVIADMIFHDLLIGFAHCSGDFLTVVEKRAACTLQRFFRRYASTKSRTAKCILKPAGDNADNAEFAKLNSYMGKKVQDRNDLSWIVCLMCESSSDKVWKLLMDIFTSLLSKLGFPEPTKNGGRNKPCVSGSETTDVNDSEKNHDGNGTTHKRSLKRLEISSALFLFDGMQKVFHKMILARKDRPDTTFVPSFFAIIELTLSMIGPDAYHFATVRGFTSTLCHLLLEESRRLCFLESDRALVKSSSFGWIPVQEEASVIWFSEISLLIHQFIENNARSREFIATHLQAQLMESYIRARSLSLFQGINTHSSIKTLSSCISIVSGLETIVEKTLSRPSAGAVMKRKIHRSKREKAEAQDECFRVCGVLLASFVENLGDGGHELLQSLRRIQKLLDEIANMFSPIQKLPGVMILLHRAASQEEYFSGKIETNPIRLDSVPLETEQSEENVDQNMVRSENSSTPHESSAAEVFVGEPKVGGIIHAPFVGIKSIFHSTNGKSFTAEMDREPTMRDLRAKIASDLNFHHAKDIMELLVAGKIINLDLSIRAVFEKVWKPFCLKSVDTDGRCNRGSGNLDTAVSHVDTIDVDDCSAPDDSSVEASTHDIDVVPMESSDISKGDGVWSHGSYVNVDFKDSHMGLIDEYSDGDDDDDEESVDRIVFRSANDEIIRLDGGWFENTIGIQDSSQDDCHYDEDDIDVSTTMKVTYRLCGIDGEATEDVVDILSDDTDDAAGENPEVLWSRTLKFCEGKGANKKQGFLALLRILEHATAHFCVSSSVVRQVLGTVIVVLNLVCKCESNRQSMVELGAIPILLKALTVLFEEVSAAPLAESFVLILEDLISEDSAVNLSSLSFGNHEQIQLDDFLQQLENEHSALRRCPRLLKAMAQHLRFLTYGDKAKIHALVKHFMNSFNLERLRQIDDGIDCGGDRRGQLPPDCVFWCLDGLGNDQCSTLIRKVSLASGFTQNLVSYVLNCIPKDLDRKTFLGRLAQRPSTALVLRMVAGLCKGHEDSQNVVFCEEWIELCMDLQKMTAGEGLYVADCADSLLAAVSENNEKVSSIVHQIREKRNRAMQKKALSRRENMLMKMKASVGQASEVSSDKLDGASSTKIEMRKKRKGRKKDLSSGGIGPKKAKLGTAAPIEPSWITEMAALEDEDGIVCTVCQEGYKYKNMDPLGVYVYRKAILLWRSIPFVDSDGEARPLALFANDFSCPAVIQKSPIEQRRILTEMVGEAFAKAFESPCVDSVPLWTFLKTISNVEGKSRSTRNHKRISSETAYGYSSVSSFNCIHFDCHVNAVEAEKSDVNSQREEWEGARLRNGRTLCNNLLPFRGPESISSSRYAETTETFQKNDSTRKAKLISSSTYSSSDTRVFPSSFSDILLDLRFLLLRFAYEEPLNEDTQGGGYESNFKLLVPLLSLGNYFWSKEETVRKKKWKEIHGHYVLRSLSLLEEDVRDSENQPHSLKNSSVFSRDKTSDATSFPDFLMNAILAIFLYEYKVWRSFCVLFLKGAIEYSNEMYQAVVDKEIPCAGSGACGTVISTKKHRGTSTPTSAQKESLFTRYKPAIFALVIVDELYRLSLTCGDSVKSSENHVSGSGITKWLSCEALAIDNMIEMYKTYSEKLVKVQCAEDLLIFPLFAESDALKAILQKLCKPEPAEA